MADTDFVTEGQVNALITAIVSKVNLNVVVIDIGSTASAARTAGNGIQYWICNAGVTPSNAVVGDFVFRRDP